MRVGISLIHSRVSLLENVADGVIFQGFELESREKLQNSMRICTPDRLDQSVAFS